MGIIVPPPTVDDETGKKTGEFSPRPNEKISAGLNNLISIEPDIGKVPPLGRQGILHFFPNNALIDHCLHLKVAPLNRQKIKKFHIKRAYYLCFREGVLLWKIKHQKDLFV
jgi:hypothetical protein